MAYIYALVDIRKPGVFKTKYFTLLYEPYYIGKASTIERPTQHYVESIRKLKKGGKRTYKQNKILNLIKNNISFEYVLFECESEDDAFLKEMELIKLFGRYSDGGILTNVNHGGLAGTKRGYVHCHDRNGHTVYVNKNDKRIETGEYRIVGFGERCVMCFDEDNNVYKVPCDEYDPIKHRSIHLGVKRDKETREKISKAKLKYKFTKEHLDNLTKANRLIAKNVHLGAKRKESTKKSISKSRYGSKSKVANIWRVTSPSGDSITYKGGLILIEKLFNINANRLIRYEGSTVPYPNYAGHKSQAIFNTTGWKLEKNPEVYEINFEFMFQG